MPSPDKRSCICPKGLYFNTEKMVCFKCLEGSHSKSTGSSQCICEPGNMWVKNRCEPCRQDQYTSPINLQCKKCDPSATPNLSRDGCQCQVGHEWNSEDEVCASCQDMQYSVDGEKCISCPTNSTFMSGASKCVCSSGWIWSADHCLPCGEGTFSVSGDATCSKCPYNSTSKIASSYCRCSTGMFWDFNSNYCDMCEEGTFSLQGSTMCTQCPNGTESPIGASSCSCNEGMFWNRDVCEHCPSNTYSPVKGATTCKKCPLNSASSSGSVVCKSPLASKMKKNNSHFTDILSSPYLMCIS